MKKWIAPVLALGLALSACSQGGMQKVSEEEAPDGILKELAALETNNDSDTVYDTLTKLVTKTGEQYGYQIELDAEQKSSYPSIQNEELAVSNAEIKSRNIRFAKSDQLYEFLWQQIGQNTAQAAMMDASPDTAKLVRLSLNADGKYVIDAIQDQNLSLGLDEDSDVEYIMNQSALAPIYPYLGTNYILQPLSDTKHYSYELFKQGNQYIFIMKIKDVTTYNEDIDSYVNTNYGYPRTDLNGDGSIMVDEYTTTDATFKIYMDETGLIQKIENENKSDLEREGKTITVGETQSVTLTKAPDDFETFAESTFKGIKDETIKQGDTLDIKY